MLLEAPDDFASLLGELPQGVTISSRLTANGRFDIILLFMTRLSELQRRFQAVVNHLNPSGGFWVAWPKKASGVPTDITEDRVRDVALPAGLVDNKVCAIDETWSGLRCVIRLKNRPS